MIALQAEFKAVTSGPSDPYAAHGVHNHAILVRGSTLHAGDPYSLGVPMTPKLFVEEPLGSIKARLEEWASDIEDDNAWFDRETFRGFLILDIEHPLRPVEFRTWFMSDTDPTVNFPDGVEDDPDYEDNEGNPILLDHMIDGFNRRILAARQTFPHAKLAVYPMVVGHSCGDCTTNLEINIGAWEYASSVISNVPIYDSVPPGQGQSRPTYSRRSWLDRLDYVCVQLYLRYGPDDDSTLYNETTTKAFVRQGIQIAKRLADMEAGVGVLPLLGFRIHNPGEPDTGCPPTPLPNDPDPQEVPSCDNDEAATVEYVTWQIEELRRWAFACTDGYTADHYAFCFWDGDGELGTPRPSSTGEPQDIYEFMDALFFGICDLNGVGDDGGLWSEAVNNATAQPSNPLHMVFDVDGDRFVTKDVAGSMNDDQDVYDDACGP